jgi:CheY-like chemotaxis protein
MPIERSVLVMDGGGAPRAALAHRLRRLGYRTLRAKSPEDAFRLVEEHRHLIGLALIPPDLAVIDLPAALAALASSAPGGQLAYVVTGATPSGDALDELRQSGVRLALWEPFDDGRLRFQVNRALTKDDAGGLPRRETRAPVDLPAQVHQSGRQKPARVYTLAAGGAYLETPRPAMRGARVEVETSVGAGPVRAAGIVVYTNVPGNLHRDNLPVGMGVRFTDVSEPASAAIRRLVAETSLTLSI